MIQHSFNLYDMFKLDIYNWSETPERYGPGMVPKLPNVSIYSALLHDLVGQPGCKMRALPIRITKTSAEAVNSDIVASRLAEEFLGVWLPTVLSDDKGTVFDELMRDRGIVDAKYTYNHHRIDDHSKAIYTAVKECFQSAVVHECIRVTAMGGGKRPGVTSTLQTAMLRSPYTMRDTRYSRARGLCISLPMDDGTNNLFFEAWARVIPGAERDTRSTYFRITAMGKPMLGILTSQYFAPSKHWTNEALYAMVLRSFSFHFPGVVDAGIVKDISIIGSSDEVNAYIDETKIEVFSGNQPR